MDTSQLEPKHKKIILDILNKYQLKCFVFGSRAKGQAKKFSNLDLVTKQQPQKSTFLKFKDELEESNLPYKVDLLMWDNLSETFKQQIQADLLPFVE